MGWDALGVRSARLGMVLEDVSKLFVRAHLLDCARLGVSYDGCIIIGTWNQSWNIALFTSFTAGCISVCKHGTSVTAS